MSNHPKMTCVSSAHQNLEVKLRELQEKFCHLQAARKEGRHGDLALLEAQISQNLREWQLTAPSPESSLLGEGISQFLEEFAPLLKLDEEDDAAPKPEPEGFAQTFALQNGHLIILVKVLSTGISPVVSEPHQ